ncbi:helix-turn-helix domain-containing protein [Streptomyces orinoci]|uniref:Helix-turn-helix transcriptional regulator n=1 Tax=Streptomyces orinoci TaxID=67339 RepID=A0ABV3K7C7_STRON
MGTELRRLRESAGKTARAAGELLGTDQAKMSMIEAGRRGISEERIRKLAGFYACDDPALIDALCGIARERRGQFWWDAYRDALPASSLDVAELEHHATYVRTVQMLVVLGIFQTRDYARAIFGNGLPVNELEALVEFRTRRRMVLNRAEPVPYKAIVHEAALRMRYGGRRVAKGQLGALLEAADWPSVTLRVIPFEVEEITGHAQSVFYAGGAVPQLDTVHIDSPFGGGFLDALPQLVQYRELMNVIEDTALSPGESRDLINQIAREM